MFAVFKIEQYYLYLVKGRLGWGATIGLRIFTGKKMNAALKSI